jgi:GT2 family glycosyltransferase
MTTGPRGIDIIVPVYKNAALTARCLQSIAANVGELSPTPVRLLLINDSPDDTEVAHLLAEFAAAHPYATVITNEANMGFVQTANRGLAWARDARHDAVLVNSDTETYPGTLAEVASVAYADPQIAFVSPRSNNASLCSLPHPNAGKTGAQAETYEHWRRLSRMLPRYHFVPTAVGFYIYIKHAVLANIGLLDPDFGVGYEEENDLIMRASKVGYRAALANHAFAYHASSASFTLTGLDLSSHRKRNLQTITNRHPEFLPLVRKYERSAHFRAEALLGRLLPSARGALSMVIDLSSLGCDYNGTNEFSVAVLSRLCERNADQFDFAALCSVSAFRFHRLDAIGNLRRLEPHVLPDERFAVAVRLAQPFDTDAIGRLAELAPINVYVMHDAIALDCGYLSIERPIEELWTHVASHATGLCYISNYSQQTFEARFNQAASLPHYTRLSSTRLADYEKKRMEPGEHVLILGNHYAHKASDATAKMLAVAFPDIRFVVFGNGSMSCPNVASVRAGLISEEEVEQFYARARVIVLPSYVEGFGLGLVHALAAGKVVLARDIPPTREILATYRDVSGVFLYRDETEICSAMRSALEAKASHVDDSGATGWSEWADGFADFCRALAARDDLFTRCVQRLQAVDLMRRAEIASSAPQVRPRICRSVDELLGLEGEEFVNAAYWTLFNRSPDPEGKEHYLSELEAGVSKLTIVARLRYSDEGRRKQLPLAGFRRAHFAHRFRLAGGTAKPRS